MSIHRRDFLRHLAAGSAGFLGLQHAASAGVTRRMLEAGGTAGTGYGPILPDPLGYIDLPAGFTYRVISQSGQPMSDGFQVPSLPDGMGCFAGPGSTVILVRNHENDDLFWDGPFGPTNANLPNFPRALLFDDGGMVSPPRGGTTTIVYDLATGATVSQCVSLAGTNRNCSGGVTPWGTWLSGEENYDSAGLRNLQRDHGWVFEVPATAAIGAHPPRPLYDLGRFLHEAAAVDPETGVVYLTEDTNEACLYRFVPNVWGDLTAGGVLQALVVLDMPRAADLRNQSSQTVTVGQRLAVSWVTITDPRALSATCSQQGRARGAAIFARGEGAWFGRGALFFACTAGGLAAKGQLWKFVPAANPRIGIDRDGIAGWLELFVEPNDANVFDMGDTVSVAPTGDVLVCEDGHGNNEILGICPDGSIYKFARNPAGTGEYAGVCFSPDGSTMFLNDYNAGYTFAINGPW